MHRAAILARIVVVATSPLCESLVLPSMSITTNAILVPSILFLPTVWIFPLEDLSLQASISARTETTCTHVAALPWLPDKSVKVTE